MCDTYQFFNLSIVAKKGQWPGFLDSMLFQNLVWCVCKAGNGEGTEKGSFRPGTDGGREKKRLASLLASFQGPVRMGPGTRLFHYLNIQACTKNSLYS